MFNKLVAKVLGTGRRFSPHGLRHTWASLHMARGTPLKWIQTQGGWTTAKVLLDTYGHIMPTESGGFADALTASPNGPQTAPDSAPRLRAVGSALESEDDSGSYDDGESSVQPRSPIMHFTDPPPFFRNSETSATIGSTPQRRT